MNRNLVSKVGPGSIVMVPRPIDGVIYCGGISGPFRVSFDLVRWQAADKAFTAAGILEHDGRYLSGEIAQGWDVDEFVRIPVPMVPASIRRSLFGRSTYGVIEPIKGERDNPLQAISDLMDRRKRGLGLVTRDWTLDRETIRQRLVDVVTPNLFEALVVSVLQMDQPELSWVGVGGSGDGGVDGDVVALLQCKWRIESKEALFPTHPLSHAAKSTTHYLAWMFGRPPTVTGADDLLNLDWLVDGVLRHHERLPFAVTIRAEEKP